MASVARIVKAGLKPKFATRQHNRCQLCGRSHGYIRKFGMCRVCFREYASRGQIPGVTKASW